MRAAQDRPNIILINCDDLGYGDLGCYGSTRNATPHLDRLAAEGMRFTDFYMASPVCSPSRGAMMTGCYPRRIGFDLFHRSDRPTGVLFPGMAEGLHPDEITVARILRDAGYATKLVGKWHCGDQPAFLPTRHGFDSYYGLPYSNDMGVQAGRPLDYPPLPLLRDEEVIQAQPDQTAITERYVEESVRFLRERRDAPFFLYLAHMYVHRPLYVPSSFLAASENGRYGAAVACIDWSVGVLLAELRRLGLEENTLIAFTSDNGSRAGDEGGSNAPLRGTKGTTWEGGQRLPLIVRWPGGVRAGETCAEVATSMDLLPTFARLAGAKPPDDRVIDGRDLGPLLRAEHGAASPHEAFYYYNMDVLCAVRSGPWKLHVFSDGARCRLLYRLDEDIGETTDVAERHPDEVRRLESLLDRMREDLGDSVTGAEGARRRPLGRVENPVPLTLDAEDYPLVAAEYDLEDAG